MEDFIHKNYYLPWRGARAPVVLRNFYRENGSVKQFPKNAVLFEHGDRIECAYFLVKGLCIYNVSFKEGKENTIALVLPGTAIALIADVMSGSLLTPTGCTVYSLPRAFMWDKIHADPELAMAYEQQIASWSAGALLGAMLNAQLEVEERIAVFLQSLAHETNREPVKGYYSVGYKISHEFIRHFVNANRVTVSKTMSAWQKEGRIIIHNSIIAISEDMYQAHIYR